MRVAQSPFPPYSSSLDGQRLMALILLIAIAYTCAVLAGRNSRQMGLQKYVGRLKELKRESEKNWGRFNWSVWSDPSSNFA